MLLMSAFILCAFSTTVFSDALDTKLEACKNSSEKEYCVGSALLDAIRTQVQPPGNGTGGVDPNGYCQCRSKGMANAKSSSLLWVAKVGLPLTLAEDLIPTECLEALRYPPCKTN